MRRQMFENERTFLEAVAGDLLKGGTGTVDLNNNNSTWGGDITVTNGVLRPLQNNALGDKVGGTTVRPGGTVDVNGSDLGTEPFFILGDGFNGQGAIINTGGDQINATHQITLLGDATVGGTSRWDIRGGAADTCGEGSTVAGAPGTVSPIIT